MTVCEYIRPRGKIFSDQSETSIEMSQQNHHGLSLTRHWGVIMASQQDLQKVRQIVLAGLQKYPVHVLLFGSHATGRAGRTSAIDVAILPQEKLPVGLLSQLREQLEGSNVPYRVDLVDLTETDEKFRQRVLLEGIPWND